MWHVHPSGVLVSSTVPPIYITHADIIVNSSVVAQFAANVVVSESDRVLLNMRDLLLLLLLLLLLYFFLWLCSSARAMASSFTRFLGLTQRRATVGRTPLDECNMRDTELNVRATRL
jgi:hypothetical protein